MNLIIWDVQNRFVVIINCNVSIYEEQFDVTFKPVVGKYYWNCVRKLRYQRSCAVERIGFWHKNMKEEKEEGEEEEEEEKKKKKKKKKNTTIRTKERRRTVLEISDLTFWKYFSWQSEQACQTLQRCDKCRYEVCCTPVLLFLRPLFIWISSVPANDTVSCHVHIKFMVNE